MKYSFYKELVKSTLLMVSKDEERKDYDAASFHSGMLTAFALVCDEVTGNKGKYDIATNKFYIGGVEV